MKKATAFPRWLFENRRVADLSLFPIVNAGLVRREELLSGSVNRDGIDKITTLDGIDHILSLGCFSIDSVFPIKVRSWPVSDEKL